MKKRILINGSQRSGTTFTGVLIEEYTKELTLQEPLNLFNELDKELILSNISKVHNQIKDKLIKEKKIILANKNRFFEIFKKHHSFLRYSKYSCYNYFFDVEGLKSFLLDLKDYHIKETKLHFYLNESFIKNNWKVFHIIRNPIDSYISRNEKLLGDRRRILIGLLNKINFNMSLLLKSYFKFISKKSYNLLIDLVNYFIVLKDIKNNDELQKIINNIFKSHYHIFIWRWTLTNYYALNSINIKKQLIVFEDKKSYYKIFDYDEDFIKIVNQNYKPVMYPNARKTLFNKFLEASKELNIEEEFKEICEIGGYM